MDGTTRCMILLLATLSGSGCSFWKSRMTKTVELPEPPKSPPLVLKDDQNLDIQFALARTLEQERNLDQAASLYRQILDKDSNHAGATHRLAIVYDQQGLFDESEQLFQRSLELHPGNADLFCDVGYSFYRQQKWQQAEQNFRQAIAITPTHKRAHNHLGLTLAATAQDEEALKEFHKSGCSLTEARMNLALIQSFDGRLDEAQKNYELARSSDPNNPEIAKRIREVDAVLASVDSVPATRQNEQLAQRTASLPPIRQVGFEDASSPSDEDPQEATDDLASDRAPIRNVWQRLTTRRDK